MTQNKISFTQEELNQYPLLSKIGVGMQVVALPESDYEGLGGVITDVLYGKERETENESILDIVVDFEEDAPLEKTHPHLNGTGIDNVFVGEDELAFYIDGAYVSGKGQLYCEECSELKTTVVQTLEEDHHWEWNGEKYVHSVSYGGGYKKFADCGHEVYALRYLEKTSEYLSEPLSEEEMKEMRDESGYIEGVVAIELSKLIHGDRETFLDTISEKLTGSTLLMDISYEVAGSASQDNSLVLVKVVGDASAILQD